MLVGTHPKRSITPPTRFAVNSALMKNVKLLLMLPLNSDKKEDDFNKKI